MNEPGALPRDVDRSGRDMSGRPTGPTAFDSSGKTLSEGIEQGAAAMLRAFQASLGLLGAPGEPAGVPAQPDTSLACLELHSGSVVIEIQVLVALRGVAAHDLPILEGSLGGDICSAPGTTWRVTGGTSPDIPSYKRSRFEDELLYIYAERGPLESTEAEALAAQGNCAQAVTIIGFYLNPGLYRGFYLFQDDLSGFKSHETLFKGWQPCGSTLP